MSSDGGGRYVGARVRTGNVLRPIGVAGARGAGRPVPWTFRRGGGKVIGQQVIAVLGRGCHVVVWLLKKGHNIIIWKV